jgi:TatD DNase family protein
VRAVTQALDILQDSGALVRCTCIFHWFSGTSDELHRALKAGCLFSVNEMMLRTRRGREYARQLPQDRLLLETDLPPGEGVPFSAQGIVDALQRTAATLAEIRHTTPDEIRRLTTTNAERILLGR